MFSRPSPTFLAAFIAAVVAQLLFLAINGGLIFFFDTSGYYGGAKVLLQYLQGADVTGSTSFLGRSIYYGLLMQWELAYAPFAPAQILSVALMLAIASRVILGAARPLAAGLASAVMCLITPLPFFAINEMPDVYAGLAILGTALFLVYGERMEGRHKAGVALVMVLAVLFHQTHLIILAGFAVMAGIGFLAAALAGRKVMQPARARLLPVLLVVASGIAGDIAFRVGMEAIQDQAPVRRPFILGRLIADGPGYRYLQANCPQEGWVMCNHMQNLPVNIDWFLWSNHPERRVYRGMTRAERRQLEREEFDLVARIIKAEPGAVLMAAGQNWRRQLDMFTVEDFFYSEPMVSGIENSFGPLAGDVRGQRIVTSESRLAALSAVQGWLLYAGMAAIIALAIRPARQGVAGADEERDFRLFAALLVCGLLMNGAVCGMLSEPHHRYQARVIWLLPYAAILYAALWAGWRKGKPGLNA